MDEHEKEDFEITASAYRMSSMSTNGGIGGPMKRPPMECGESKTWMERERPSSGGKGAGDYYLPVNSINVRLKEGVTQDK